eukprot:gnl/Chilomastix_cuspidata/4273.p1 GENE.gnl/Chilomastix_cuspidata/4273~~gnl/Chilomastix_cuspidata/4273.p1  ORF type:complete len:261 (+),score=84.03 gnl/Chilomastix_cuspidata/4273:560-1342(+)
MQWVCPNMSSDPLLLTACADGILNVHALRGGRAAPTLERVGEASASSSICLSVSLHTADAEHTVLTTSTDGTAALYTLRGAGGPLVAEASWRCCEHEPWAGAVLSRNIIATGGDDTRFQLWDRRSQAPFFMSAPLDGGVTVLTPLSAQELCVGSYDETLRVVDVRAPSRYVAEAPAVGGIWRVKPLRRPAGTLLAVAGMYGGFCTFDYARGGLTRDRTYVGPHDCTSIAYGIDWLHDGAAPAVACASFYDRCVSVAVRAV